MPHELDAQYSSLKCDLVLLDKESPEFQMVHKYMAATSEESAKKILEVWKVDRHNVVSLERAQRRTKKYI